MITLPLVAMLVTWSNPTTVGVGPYIEPVSIEEPAGEGVCADCDDEDDD